MKLLLNILILFSFFSLSAQDKKMAITVDDLPTVPYGISEYKHRWDITDSIVKVFQENDIPAIGYVNEVKLYKNGTLDSAEVKLLELWYQSGLELGNHTYSHMNYHKVPFENFSSDIVKGEKVIKALAERYHSEIKYFRHPYLRAGLRQSHTDSLKAFLAQHGYIEAPVTIDNDDYLFAAAYGKAYKKGDTALMTKIGDEYVRYMEDKLLFYEKQSMKLFDRHMDQTLLIHANYLNANYLDDLIEIYKKHGYSFVSQSEVLKDPAYQEKVTKFGDWGISWIDRWALSEGKKGEFFADDPRTPEYIQELAK